MVLFFKLVAHGHDKLDALFSWPERKLSKVERVTPTQFLTAYAEAFSSLNKVLTHFEISWRVPKIADPSLAPLPGVKKVHLVLIQRGATGAHAHFGDYAFISRRLFSSPSDLQAQRDGKITDWRSAALAAEAIEDFDLDQFQLMGPGLRSRSFFPTSDLHALRPTDSWVSAFDQVTKGESRAALKSTELAELEMLVQSKGASLVGVCAEAPPLLKKICDSSLDWKLEDWHVTVQSRLQTAPVDRVGADADESMSDVESDDRPLLPPPSRLRRRRLSSAPEGLSCSNSGCKQPPISHCLHPSCAQPVCLQCVDVFDFRKLTDAYKSAQTRTLNISSLPEFATIRRVSRTSLMYSQVCQVSPLCSSCSYRISRPSTDEVCDRCDSGATLSSGTLVQCVGCFRLWHGACAEPPFKMSSWPDWPSINWLCQICEPKRLEYAALRIDVLPTPPPPSFLAAIYPPPPLSAPSTVPSSSSALRSSSAQFAEAARLAAQGAQHNRRTRSGSRSGEKR